MKIIWPMGCKKIEDEAQFKKIIHDPSFVGQVKLDGVRGIMQFDDNGLSRYTTRGASVDDRSVPIDITHRLRHLVIRVDKKAHPIFDNLILDGEFYTPKYTAAKVSGMISHKSTVPVDPDIKFCIFDILGFKGQDIHSWSWPDRMSALEIIKPIFEKKPEKFQFIPWVTTAEEKLNLFYKEIEEGREGIVLKNRCSPYFLGKPGKSNKPSHVWYKMKCEDTVDGVLLCADPPEMFYKDPTTGKNDYNRFTKFWEREWLGALVFRFEDDDGTVHVAKCSGMTDEVRAMFSENLNLKPEFVGRTIEVKYMQKTDDGNLRSPRFVRLREEIEK